MLVECCSHAGPFLCLSLPFHACSTRNGRILCTCGRLGPEKAQQVRGCVFEQLVHLKVNACAHSSVPLTPIIFQAGGQDPVVTAVTLATGEIPAFAQMW